MKHSCLLLIIWSLVLSCGSLPKIHDTEPMPERICTELYPEGDWQLLHTIEATLPGNQKGFLMGVTVLSAREKIVNCVMMTLEGFVVFEAEYDGQVRVVRAVAPFDSNTFAQGLMADIQLIFFKPPAVETIAGKLEDGRAVCRYSIADGSLVDVLNPGENQFETRLYRSGHHLVRTVKRVSEDKPDKTAGTGLADRIELIAHGSPGYKLILDLVEAIPLSTEGAGAE